MDIGNIFSNFEALMDTSPVARPLPLDFDWRVRGDTIFLLSRDTMAFGADISVIRAFLEREGGADVARRIFVLLSKIMANGGDAVGLVDTASSLGRAAIMHARLTGGFRNMFDVAISPLGNATPECAIGFGVPPIAVTGLFAAWPARGALVHCGTQEVPRSAPIDFSQRMLGVDLGDGPLHGAWWGIRP